MEWREQGERGGEGRGGEGPLLESGVGGERNSIQDVAAHGQHLIM